MPTNIHYPGEVLEQTEIGLEWMDLQKLTRHERPQHVRSKGVHLSGVIKVISQKRGLLKEEDQTDDMPTVVLLGICFEDGAVQLYEDLIWQPGEVKKDGIIGSPDGKSPILGYLDTELGWMVEEFKLTYKSNRYRQDIRAEQMWMMQIMGYLKMMGLTVARLHVLWACDNYVMPFRPKYIRYLIRFTQEELDQNWKLMLKFKQFAIRE
jgi:hypothetical protein